MANALRSLAWVPSIAMLSALASCGGHGPPSGGGTETDTETFEADTEAFETGAETFTAPDSDEDAASEPGDEPRWGAAWPCSEQGGGEPPGLVVSSLQAGEVVVRTLQVGAGYRSEVTRPECVLHRVEWQVAAGELQWTYVAPSGSLTGPIPVPETSVDEAGLSMASLFLVGQHELGQEEQKADGFTGSLSPQVLGAPTQADHRGCDGIPPSATCWKVGPGGCCDAHDACIAEHCTEVGSGNVRNLPTLLAGGYPGLASAGACVACHAKAVGCFVNVPGWLLQGPSSCCKEQLAGPGTNTCGCMHFCFQGGKGLWDPCACHGTWVADECCEPAVDTAARCIKAGDPPPFANGWCKKTCSELLSPCTRDGSIAPCCPAAICDPLIEPGYQTCCTPAHGACQHNFECCVGMVGAKGIGPAGDLYSCWKGECCYVKGHLCDDSNDCCPDAPHCLPFPGLPEKRVCTE